MAQAVGGTRRVGVGCGREGIESGLQSAGYMVLCRL